MNKIEKIDNKIVKSFGSRMDFVRELSIYEKLKGTNLAPEITGKWDGSIELEYIEGASLTEVFESIDNDPDKILVCANQFVDWYKQYREITKISIGDIDFSDFIITPDRFVCIDFEHCKPGFAEDDIASLAAKLCLFTKQYTMIGLENAKTFVSVAQQKLDLVSEKLSDSMRRAMQRECKDLGIASMPSADEYLSTYVCCEFMPIPDSHNRIDSMINALSSSKQKWTMFATDKNGALQKYMRYIMSIPKENVDAIFLTEHSSIVEFPLLLNTAAALSILKLARGTKMNLRDVLMLNMHSRGVAAEDLKAYKKGDL